MGKRGPKPKPTILKLLGGNPGRRPIDAEEPKPFPLYKKVLPPAHLNQAAKLHWHKMVKLLQPLGLYTEADRDSLAQYCAQYSRWAKAEKQIQELGELDDGKVSPWIKIADKAMEQMNKLSRCFGLSPADRVGLKAMISKPEEVDAFEQLLKGKTARK